MKANQLIIDDDGDVCAPVMEMPTTRPDSTPFRKTDDLDGFLKLDIEYHQAIKQAIKTAIKLKDQKWGVKQLVNTHFMGVTHLFTGAKKNHPYQVPEFEFEVKTGEKCCIKQTLDHPDGCNDIDECLNKVALIVPNQKETTII